MKKALFLILSSLLFGGCHKPSLPILLGEKEPDKLIRNISYILDHERDFDRQIQDMLVSETLFKQPDQQQKMFLYVLAVKADSSYCDPLIKIASDQDYFDSNCIYSCAIELAVYRACGRDYLLSNKLLNSSTSQKILGDIEELDRGSKVEYEPPSFADTEPGKTDREYYIKLGKQPTDQLLKILVDLQIPYDERWVASMQLIKRKMDSESLPQLIFIASTDDGSAREIEDACQICIMKIFSSEEKR